LVPHPVGVSVARFQDESTGVDYAVTSIGWHTQERLHGCFQSRLLGGRQELLDDASPLVFATGPTLQPLASEMEAAPFDFRHPDRNWIWVRKREAKRRSMVCASPYQRCLMQGDQSISKP
tara:strand:+ start:1511 stop:1870 length:360 start_codon:yes stop_codon:yes gene_type:complete